MCREGNPGIAQHHMRSKMKSASPLELDWDHRRHASYSAGSQDLRGAHRDDPVGHRSQQEQRRSKAKVSEYLSPQRFSEDICALKVDICAQFFKISCEVYVFGCHKGMINLDWMIWTRPYHSTRQTRYLLLVHWSPDFTLFQLQFQ